MDQFGIKVSLTGKEVENIENKDTIYTSDYPAMKVFKSGHGTMPASSSGDQLVIPHNLGYVPMFMVMTQATYSITKTFPYKMSPNYFYNLSYFEQTYAYATTTDLVIMANSNMGREGHEPINYQYYIFLDEIK